jgi:hypothetical protein
MLFANNMTVADKTGIAEVTYAIVAIGRKIPELARLLNYPKHKCYLIEAH